jgi:hypothetical protein
MVTVTTGAGGIKVTVALADLVGSATLVAVTVTFCWIEIDEGAVYSPADDKVPKIGFMDQVTAVFGVPVTVAVNWRLCEADRLTLAGLIETDTAGAGGVNAATALADLVGSATLVAVTVTFCWIGIDDGAVYSPEADNAPAIGFIDQVTAVFGLPLTVAAN